MFLAGLVMYAVSIFLKGGELTFMVWSVILFIIYLTVLYVLGEIKKDDINVVRGLLTRKKTAEIEEEFSGNEPSA
jgi:hypothetical protein